LDGSTSTVRALRPLLLIAAVNLLVHLLTNRHYRLSLIKN
jgi:hypothetical protein